LLVNAIPVPDPGVRWGAAIRSADEEQAAPMAKGCKFYNRCPYGMDICTETEPPLYEVGPEHYTACYLHRDKPVKEQEAQATA
jgi:oligopeptide/dipeptide ABC transporter ATP-binding protein